MCFKKTKRSLLILCSLETKIKEICAFLVGRSTSRIPLSLLWSRSSPINHNKNSQVTNFSFQQTSDSSNELSWWDASFVIDNRKIINDQGYYYFCSICKKFQNIHANSSLTNRVSWNETVSSSEKGGVDYSDVSKCKEKPFDINGLDNVT